MGKKGAAMRSAKAQTVMRTFTEEQLREHDRLLIQNYRKQVANNAKDYMHAEKNRMWGLIEEEWERRTELLRADDGTPGGFLTVLNLLMSTSCRVLIEHFGWPSMARSANRRYRTARFCELLVDEVNRIISDDSVDIRTYNEETLKMYGIQFFTEKPEEEA